MVLQRSELEDRRLVRPVVRRRVALLVPTEQKGVDGRGQKREGQSHEDEQDDPRQVRPLANPRAEAGAVRRLERPPQMWFGTDELADGGAYRPGLAAAQVGPAVEEVAYRLAELGLLQDLLPRPAAGVDVGGRCAGDAAPEPVEALTLARSAAGITVAMAEDSVDALAGSTDELGQVLLRRHVEIGQVDEVRGQRSACVVGFGRHDDDPREVDA